MQRKDRESETVNDMVKLITRMRESRCGDLLL